MSILIHFRLLSVSNYAKHISIIKMWLAKLQNLGYDVDKKKNCENSKWKQKDLHHDIGLMPRHWYTNIISYLSTGCMMLIFKTRSESSCLNEVSKC